VLKVTAKNRRGLGLLRLYVIAQGYIRISCRVLQAVPGGHGQGKNLIGPQPRLESEGDSEKGRHGKQEKSEQTGVLFAVQHLAPELGLLNMKNCFH
jgi:hypothetical protein